MIAKPDGGAGLLGRLHPFLYLHLLLVTVAVGLPLAMLESYSLVDAESVSRLAARLGRIAREEQAGSGGGGAPALPRNSARPGDGDAVTAIDRTGLATVRDKLNAGIQFSTADGIVAVMVSHRTGAGFTLKFARMLESKAAETYPIFRFLTDRFLLPAMALLLAAWMMPYYRHAIAPSADAARRAERRIVHLPVFLVALLWLYAAVNLAVKCAAFKVCTGGCPPAVLGVFLVSFLVFGAMATLLTLGIIQPYINRRIAIPFFARDDPGRLRSGHAISLSLRFLVIVFCIGTVPTALGVYLPLSFDPGLASDLGDAVKMLERFDRTVPFLMMCLFAAYFLGLQAVAFLTFRGNIIRPIQQLVERMKRVSRGDFDCKTSVLHVDEIGQLKGHFNLMLDGLVERERVKDTFGKFMSYEIAEKLMRSERNHLTGEAIEATILFSDIRDFTPISERLTPEALVEFLNLYFSHVVDPIHRHHGIVNKYIGDAVMAVFSPLFGEPCPEQAAVRAALDMRRALAAFNALNRYPPVRSGIGIHAGTLIAGNIGTPERMEYTFIGDNVNIASRIESETKRFGTDILISRTVAERIRPADVPGVTLLELGPVLMKGKSAPLTLYGLAETPPAGG